MLTLIAVSVKYPAAAILPMAEEHQMVATVVSPRIVGPWWMIVPALAAANNCNTKSYLGI